MNHYWRNDSATCHNYQINIHLLYQFNYFINWFSCLYFIRYLTCNSSVISSLEIYFSDIGDLKWIITLQLNYDYILGYLLPFGKSWEEWGASWCKWLLSKYLLYGLCYLVCFR